MPSFCQGTLATIEQDPIELERVAHVDGGDQVAHVRRVERAAEQPDRRSWGAGPGTISPLYAARDISGRADPVRGLTRLLL